MDGDELTEHHIRLDDKGQAQPDDHGETYRYTINEENNMVLVSPLLVRIGQIK
jgi:hypothetical protein